MDNESANDHNNVGFVNKSANDHNNVGCHPESFYSPRCDLNQPKMIRGEKKGEGSSQTQGTIFTWKKTLNHPWLDPSVRFFPVYIIGSA
jgi:hypothetical protein